MPSPHLLRFAKIVIVSIPCFLLDLAQLGIGNFCKAASNFSKSGVNINLYLSNCINSSIHYKIRLVKPQAYS